MTNPKHARHKDIKAQRRNRELQALRDLEERVEQLVSAKMECRTECRTCKPTVICLPICPFQNRLWKVCDNWRNTYCRFERCAFHENDRYTKEGSAICTEREGYSRRSTNRKWQDLGFHHTCSSTAMSSNYRFWKFFCGSNGHSTMDLERW